MYGDELYIHGMWDWKLTNCNLLFSEQVSTTCIQTKHCCSTRMEGSMHKFKHQTMMSKRLLRIYSKCPHFFDILSIFLTELYRFTLTLICLCSLLKFPKGRGRGRKKIATASKASKIKLTKTECQIATFFQSIIPHPCILSLPVNLFKKE